MDMVHALSHDLGFNVVQLWHKDRDLQGVEAVVLPAVSVTETHLRSGAIARFSPIMEEVVSFAHGGGRVMGVCNGFQILCEAGPFPGRFAQRKPQIHLPQRAPRLYPALPQSLRVRYRYAACDSNCARRRQLLHWRRWLEGLAGQRPNLVPVL